MTWPLSCLESDSKLYDRFRDFKLNPEGIMSLESDSNLNLFLARDENRKVLLEIGDDPTLSNKCEWLLAYEYLILKERTKN